MPFKGSPAYAADWVPPRLADRWNAGSDAIGKTLKRSKTARRITPARYLPNAEWEAVDLHTADGARLSAWFVPAERTDLAVVLHHHYGGQKATVLPWIAVFHAMGLPCLAFDARGHADSDETPVGRGSFPKRTADVDAACAELRRRGFDRLLGFGQSQGAATLVMAAPRNRFEGLILDSGPAPEMGTAAWGLSGNMLGRRGKEEPATRAMLAARIIPGTEPVRYLGTLWAAFARLRGTPLLWLHGDRDGVIERRWSNLWFRSMRGPRWVARTVAGADHVRTLPVGGEAVEADVAAFIDAL
jgi:alpha-beta hydrolase superfamily lysophospholipase